MEVGKLKVQLRNNKGKGTSRKLRAAGLIPGICYGAGLKEPVNLSLDPRALKASLDPAKGRNTVIEMSVEDGGAETNVVTAMLWEYQIHPLRRNVTHVDLIAIDPSKTIYVDVPIVIKGKPAGAVDGGQLHVVRHEIGVKCKPADIPASIELDVSSLHIGDNMHLYDLTLPEGVTLAGSDKYAICTCVAPKVEKASEETTEVTAAAAVEGAKPAKDDAKKEGEKK